MNKTYEYDDVAIERCGRFAEEFFNNIEQYGDKYTPNILFFNREFQNLEKRNALDNYILKFYTRLDINNPVDASIKRNMDKYLQAFYKRFMSNPTEFLDSPFLKSPAIVDTFCPEIVQIQGRAKELRKSVKEKYRENAKYVDIETLFIKDRNLENLSIDETRQLMHYLTRNIGTEDEKIQRLQKEYLKKLIGQKSKVKELDVKQVEFVAKYVNDVMLKSRLKDLGYDRSSIKNHIYVGEESENLGGYQYSYNIYINQNSILTQDIPSLIQVVCHETEHSIQELEARSSKSKIGLDFAIMDILSAYYKNEKGFDVYHKNYRFEEIEKDAEKIGTDMAVNLLDSLGFTDEARALNTSKKEKIKGRQFEYDYRQNDEGKKMTREEFLVDSLNKAIAKNPDVLNQYPSLSLLYSKDGKVKTFEEIIMGDFKLNDESKSIILDDFLKVYISRGGLNNIDLNKFPADVQTQIASRMISLLGSEMNQISEMGKNENSKNIPISKTDKEHVEIFHLKNSKRIMDFINKNYQSLSQLQDEEKFSSIIDMTMYDTYANFFRYKENYQLLTYNNQERIEAIIQVSREAENQKKLHREMKKRAQQDDKKEQSEMTPQTKKFGRDDVNAAIQSSKVTTSEIQKQQENMKARIRNEQDRKKEQGLEM